LPVQKLNEQLLLFYHSRLCDLQQSLLKLDKSGKVRKAFERLAEEILKKVN
jgi:hypothetical protein